MNDLLNSGKLPELHLRGFSGTYNFAGPGTKLDKRLDEQKRPLPHSRPINRVDQTAYEHDLDYERHSDLPSRHASDGRMIAKLGDIISDPSTGWRERADAHIVRGVIWVKKQLGFGRRRRPRK